MAHDERTAQVAKVRKKLKKQLAERDAELAKLRADAASRVCSSPCFSQGAAIG